MKNFTLSMLLVAFCVSGFAQKKKSKNEETKTTTEVVEQKKEETKTEKPILKEEEDKGDDHRAVLTQALKYGDANTAITAIHYLIQAEPTNMGLKDTLSTLYFTTNQYQQCIVVAQEILAKDAQNKKMMELIAVSEQSMGMAKEALASYEKLYVLTKLPFHLYQIAILQYSLKRLGECAMSLQGLIADPATEKEKVAVAINQQYKQEVPIKAAALNIKGVILKEQKSYADAKIAFEEALKLFPDFVLAKGNLDELKKETAPKK